jgi:hypothetical protein
MNLLDIKDKIIDFLNKIIYKINKMNKKLIMLLFVIILIIIIIITFIVGSINKKKSKECSELYNSIGVLVEDYLTQKNLYPSLQGTSVTVDLSEIDPVYFKKKQVTGYVKYTKYNDTYVKTFYIENCKYCSTSEFTKETSDYDETKNMDVVAYYNYYDVSYYNSYYTDYIEPDKISEEQTMGVNLPIDSKLLPTIPADAQVVEYVKEDKLYYSYRDILYKWYRNNIQYSDFSSEAPSGYTSKDTSTVITTEASEWSLDYPEVKSYRTIKSQTGYRWYYEENKQKIYWNDGAYYPTQPDSKYTKKSKETVTMYSYIDQMWKWYNGTVKRDYSSFMRVTNDRYPYKDSDLYQYTTWTSYQDTSSLNADNASYREEVTKTYSRYMIKYRILSFAKLDKEVTKEELENLTGKTLSELMADESIYVSTTFKFKY